jgi:uncharacterized protein
MLRVDLGRLGRDGSALVEARVPADDEMWEGCGILWNGPVDVRLRASFAGTGEVVVRGTVTGTLAQECRRCLDPLETDFDEAITVVFVSSESADPAETGGEYVFGAAGAELDLSGAVREEVILAINPYVVCDPECRGLCPRCGADLNEGACGCTEQEADPRWEALRALGARGRDEAARAQGSCETKSRNDDES